MFLFSVISNKWLDSKAHKVQKGIQLKNTRSLHKTTIFWNKEKKKNLRRISWLSSLFHLVIVILGCKYVAHAAFKYGDIYVYIRRCEMAHRNWKLEKDREKNDENMNVYNMCVSVFSLDTHKCQAEPGIAPIVSIRRRDARLNAWRLCCDPTRGRGGILVIFFFFASNG